MFIQPLDEAAKKALAAATPGEDRSRIIINSGKPYAKEMAEISTKKTYWVPCIGRYRLGGNNVAKMWRYVKRENAVKKAEKEFALMKEKMEQI